MDGEIEMLKDVLPEFLITNKTIYSILSKGIHELTEQECMDSFHVIRVGIELMLDEKLGELQRKKKVKLAENNIAKLAHQIKNPK
jgi:NifB/MoaA-like Fe-S oxidoreductase